MDVTKENVSGLVSREKNDLLTVSDFSRAFDHRPTLSTKMMILQTETGTLLVLHAFGLESFVIVYAVVQASSLHNAPRYAD